MLTCDIAVVGGGAAGFFAAINAAEHFPDLKIVIFEQAKTVLNKVRISGGGRCNVTHACYEASELIKYYPRGNKELRGPFSQFMTYDTIAWFEERGVPLKTEEDGRIFPVSDDAETIIQCLINAAQNLGIRIRTSASVSHIAQIDSEWELRIKQKEKVRATKIIMTTGGSPAAWKMVGDLGIEIVPPVPSLFSFESKHQKMRTLAGISVNNAAINIPDTDLKASGPLLITHKGISGPAVLSLSAHGARILHQKAYQFPIQINYLPSWDIQSLKDKLNKMRTEAARKQIHSQSPVPLPMRLWKTMLAEADIPSKIKWADLSRKKQNQLEQSLLEHTLFIIGKSTNKEEFVTSGGVSLKEINFKHMKAKQIDSLFFAGEVLDIDALTGGFNFQAAWTTGWIAGKSVGK